MLTNLIKLGLFILCLPLLALAEEPKVDINTADVYTMQRMLDGIGEKKAQAIIDYRNQHGFFTSPYELTQVYGIGPKTVEKNLARIVVSEPVEEENKQADVETGLISSEPTTVDNQQETDLQEELPNQETKDLTDAEPDFAAQALELEELDNSQ